MAEVSESILTSIKKQLMIDQDYTYYDPDIILNVNTAFNVLNQLGCGPEDGFEIKDDSTTWEEYTNNNKCLNMVKSYIFIYCKIVFDPPTSSFALDALKEQLKELTFRINVQVDPKE